MIARRIGFTRVRARSQGVCVLPRSAVAEKLTAMMASEVVTSRSALGRGGSGLLREPTVSLGEPPCPALPTLLDGPLSSSDKRTMRPNRRTPLAVSRVTRASESRRASQRSDGHARPSPAFEQVVTLRTATTPDIATSDRTRRTQRVLHEERNARQRLAARREPHCRH